MQSHPKMLENSSLFLKDAKADVGRSHDEEEEVSVLVYTYFLFSDVNIS